MSTVHRKCLLTFKHLIRVILLIKQVEYCRRILTRDIEINQDVIKHLVAHADKTKKKANLHPKQLSQRA